jgi:virulence-associated protein VagC
VSPFFVAHPFALHVPLYIAQRLQKMPQRTASTSLKDRSQAVRLWKEFEVSIMEDVIGKKDDDVILSPRPLDWSALLSGPFASDEFMEGVEEFPAQERSR